MAEIKLVAPFDNPDFLGFLFPSFMMKIWDNKPRYHKPTRVHTTDHMSS